MKRVYFTEEQLQNLNEIGKEVFNDDKDPRSTDYIRKLKRPSISWVRTIFLFIVLPAIVLTALFAGLQYCNFSMTQAIVIVAIVLVVYILLTVKHVFICAIKIYQRYAPDSLRNKCRFEPSCSEYMILAIEKYGLIKGLRKGICRLKRCNIDGGGYDFP